MARRKFTASKIATNATRCTANVAAKATTTLARWATPDHTGVAKLLANLPPMAWIDPLGIVLLTGLCSVLGAAASGALFVLLVVVGIPLLLGA